MNNKLLRTVTSCVLIMGLAACSSNETTSTSNDAKAAEKAKQEEQQRQAEEKAKQEEQQRQAQEQSRKQQAAQAQKQREVKQQKKEEPELCGSPEVGITCEHLQKEWENEQKIEQELKQKDAERKAQEAEYNKSHQLSQEVVNKIVIESNFMKYDSILPLPSDAQVGVGGTQIYIYKQGNKQLRMIVNKHDRVTEVNYTE